jgi:dTDP-glucose 4,6-dehydratase
MVDALKADLEHILVHTQGLWEELRDQRIFITGGTGFFGHWLLQSFAWANDQLKLNAKALVLTRDLETFRKKSPYLVEHSAIQFHIGDVRSFEFPEGSFSHVIHAATEASAKLNREDPLLMLDTIVQGTRQALEFARHCGARKFLLTSSGAVYGKQPSDVTHIPEDYQGAPDTMDFRSAYGEGKRMAELLCAIYAKQYSIDTKIARCFAFIGAYLPLDGDYAIGNFIKDGIQGDPIRVNGDGMPYRSYLYASDLAIWLWTILLRGDVCRPYNVGSDEDITIADLAYTVAETLNLNSDVLIAKKAIPNQPCERYVPSTERAKSELQLSSLIPLEESIKKTVLDIKLKNLI